MNNYYFFILFYFILNILSEIVNIDELHLRYRENKVSIIRQRSALYLVPRGRCSNAAEDGHSHPSSADVRHFLSSLDKIRGKRPFDRLLPFRRRKR